MKATIKTRNSDLTSIILAGEDFPFNQEVELTEEQAESAKTFPGVSVKVADNEPERLPFKKQDNKIKENES